MRNIHLIVVLGSICGCGGSLPPGQTGDGGNDSGYWISGDGLGGGNYTSDGWLTNSDSKTNVCGEVDVDTSAVVPTVSLLVDQSGSMTADFSKTSRWTAVYKTLMDPTSGVVKQLEGDVVFGLTLYSDSENNGVVTCPALTEVAPALNNYSAIDNKYSRAKPLDNTPTAESIDAVVAKLKPLVTDGKKVIALATDGMPDTCAVPNPDNEKEQAAANAQTVAAAQHAAAAGIKLVIISVGTALSETHLQDMANAGAGLPVGGSQKAPFYKALDPAALVSAFHTIISGVRDCKFKLQGKGVKADQASRGKVYLDGALLTYNTDWKLVDATTLELVGPSCQTVMSGGSHTVRARFSCGVLLE